MSSTNGHKGSAMPEADRVRANLFIMNHLIQTMTDGRGELTGLRKKLAVTYWVIVFLSMGMFTLGVILIGAPAVVVYRGQTEVVPALIAAGFGVADLVVLFLFKPLERIHRLMGDMSQMTLALNSFQIQVGLRLREMDAHERASIGEAAIKVGRAANQSIGMVQKYFEMGKSPR